MNTQPSRKSLFSRVSTRTWLALAVVFVTSIVLRNVWLEDMEYKYDEVYMYQGVDAVAHGAPWPELGMRSGVRWRNPGMSIWVFVFFAKIFGATHPTDVARMVGWLSLLAAAIAVLFTLKEVEEKEQEPWLWGIATALVNPITLSLHRKIWAQSILPLFSITIFWCFWKRHLRLGAFFWGLIAGIVGQIHMSGFFFAAGLAGWDLLSTLVQKLRGQTPSQKTRWGYWALGSALSVIPMIPWIQYVLGLLGGGTPSHGLHQIIQARFWVFWLTDPFGLHLGNLLGLYRSDHLLGQNADFFRWPLLGEHASYLVGAVHLGVAVIGVIVVGAGVRGLWLKRHDLLENLFSRDRSTSHLLAAVMLGFGGILTLSGVVIRRFYTAITFPLTQVWVARVALRHLSPRFARALLTALICFQVFVSIQFLRYVHHHEGAPQGDYGKAYWKDPVQVLRD